MAKTFEEWIKDMDWADPKLEENFEGQRGAASLAWHARDAEIEALKVDLAQARTEAGAAMARIAADTVQVWLKSNRLDSRSLANQLANEIIALAPTDALAEVERKAKLEALQWAYVHHDGPKEILERIAALRAEEGRK